MSKTKPSTYRQLICYYYHLKNTDPQSSISQSCQQIKEDLMGIWQSVNPRLPLISTLSVEKKIRDLLQLVKISTKNTIKLLQNEILRTNSTAFLILLGAPVLWKCYRVMTGESIVMLITTNKSTSFALAPQVLKFR